MLFDFLFLSGDHPMKMCLLSSDDVISAFFLFFLFFTLADEHKTKNEVDPFNLINRNRKLGTIHHSQLTFQSSL